MDHPRVPARTKLQRRYVDMPSERVLLPNCWDQQAAKKGRSSRKVLDDSDDDVVEPA